MLILPGKGSRPHEGIEEAFAEGLAPVDCTDRPRAQGKFLSVGGQKLWIRGVTYGAFRPDEEGKEYQDLKRIHQDFAQMAANGLNAVRIPHTMPPRPLLDAAARHRLRVMVGLSAEQFVGYLIDGRDAPDIEGTIRAKVGECAGHPAVLCYAIGNEIPAPLVRWLGRRRVERYLRRLYRAIKAEDPEGLVTYVNYPTTEFLDLSFLDLLCFNVYLEQRDRFEAYLARLQNIAGDRPLVMTEIGLDSLRNGEAAQAEALDWQVRATFAAAAAGAFVFAWTDEWHRAGADVHDWAFGLTDRERRPKPALAAVRDAFTEAPFPKGIAWPRISVIVCTYNGAERIRDCLDGLLRLEYPDFEVIVVNDGSTDGTGEIADELARTYSQVRVVHHPRNRGYGGALRTGFASATRGLIAYTDGDAQYDPSEIEVLWKRLTPEVDMVTGYKISRSDPWHRIVIGRIYHYTVKVMFGLRVRDVDCDFRLMRREIFDRVKLERDTGVICLEMMRKIQDAGFRVVEVPVHHFHRTYGRSQFFNVRRIFWTGVDVLKLWLRLVVLGRGRQSTAVLFHNPTIEGATPPESMKR